MFTRKTLLSVSVVFAASILALPAMAQGGKGGYAKITPLSGTMEIQVNNNGKKYFTVDQPIQVRFKLQGNAGVRRKMTSWRADVGKWHTYLDKAETYTRSLSLKDVYNRSEFSEKCEQLLTVAAAKKSKSKNTLRNNGWSNWFTYSLIYKTNMTVVNPYSPVHKLLRREDEATQNIIVRCLGHNNKPKKNSNKKPKKPHKQTSENQPKSSNSIRVKGSTINENNRDRPTEEVAFAFGNAAPTKETDAPRMTAGDDKVAIGPRSDLYAESGGMDPDDGTSYILLIGNKGTKATTKTEVRFHMNLNGQDPLSAQYLIPALAAGGFYELHIPSVIPLDWIKTAYARIDQPNIVPELDEKNNGFGFIASKQIKTEHDSTYGLTQGRILSYVRPDHVDVNELSGTRATGHRRIKPLTVSAPKE